MTFRGTQRIAVAALLAALLVAMTASMAMAGGWATVTLDDLPREPRAGETLTLGLTIRQHGFREIDLDVSTNPVFLFAENIETGETVRYDAVKDGNTGHFLVDVTFPSAGEWNWGVQPGWFPKLKFAPLTVLPATTPLSTALARLQAATWFGLLPARGILLAATLLAGVALAVWLAAARKQRGIAGVVAAACLMLAAALIALPRPADATGPGEDYTAGSATQDQVSYGRALFVAKGCSGCHIHESVTNGVGGPMIGPNLTYRPEDPQFLRAWLANPAAIKPNTTMPNLGLRSSEIDALVAFLTGN